MMRVNDCIRDEPKLTPTPHSVTKKLSRIDQFLKKLNRPCDVFVATRYDEYRKFSSKDEKNGKPKGGTKMWTKMAELKKLEPDMVSSVFVGDSAGGAGEFSDADLAFAKAVGVKFVHAREFFSVKRKKLVKQEDDDTEAVSSSSSKKHKVLEENE